MELLMKVVIYMQLKLDQAQDMFQSIVVSMQENGSHQLTVNGSSMKRLMANSHKSVKILTKFNYYQALFA